MTAAIIATLLCAVWALGTFYENEQRRALARETSPQEPQP
jgi:hypothetical protein